MLGESIIFPVSLKKVVSQDDQRGHSQKYLGKNGREVCETVH